MAERLKRVKGYFAYITCYIKRAKPRFFKGLRQLKEEVRLTPEIIADAMSLPDFPNRDPADELIVATARVHRLTLLTTDMQLKRYRHAQIRHFTPVLEKGG
jgi:predicted nucleic acid-binding protein